MAQYVHQQTLEYSTFIKRALRESLAAAFASHPSETVSNTRVALDFGRGRWTLPGVIIKFLERRLPNAGVGHVEYGISPTDPNPDSPTEWIKYYHRFYEGDVSFDIYAASAVDRDVVRDALVEVLAMTDTTVAGSNFINRFYNELNATPYGLWHFPVLMLDNLTGYGENHTRAPWGGEDALVYQVTYRVPVFGEFYSNTPTSPSSLGILEYVDVYPWIDGTDPSPADNPDTIPPTPAPKGWYRFAGWPAGTEII